MTQLLHRDLPLLRTYVADAQVSDYARVADSIVGWGSKLGPWSRLENHAVVGEDVTVREEVRAAVGRWGMAH